MSLVACHQWDKDCPSHPSGRLWDLATPNEPLEKRNPLNSLLGACWKMGAVQHLGASRLPNPTDRLPQPGFGVMSLETHSMHALEVF